MQRIYVRVVGTVQGVWFRGSTQEQATKLGLVGWVRNRPDGAVELEAQGDASALDSLVAWCHRGPSSARVRDVSRESIGLADGERGFEIRYD